MSKVSIIISTYNQAQLVVQAVESVLAQAFRDLEIIVVDDGSTDETPEILAPYLHAITFFRQEHQGAMIAWATGMRISKGAFLSFMHADDLMPPRKLEWQVQHLETQPALGLVYFAGQLSDGEATQIIRGVETNGDGHLDSSLVTMDFFLSGNPLIRRDCAERAGLLAAPVNQDSDWNPWQQVSLAGYEIDPQEQLILCKEHLVTFLRKLHQGDVRGAQRHMIEAVRVFPCLVTEPELFIQSVFDYAKTPDVEDPVVFAQTVLDNLPDCGRRLERFRSRLLAELSISRAFRNYTLGKMAHVRQDVVAGLRHDPSFLKNKGVFSILGKSFFNQNNKAAFTGRGNQAFDVWPSMVASIQKALGRPVDSIEPTVGGTNRATYMVKSGGHPFILRVDKEQSEILASSANVLTLDQVLAVLEQIRGVGVPVPSIVAYHFPAPDKPDPAWVLEEWIPGHHFIPQNMLWRHAQAVATELGRSLRRLHSIETRGFGAISSVHLEAAHQTFDQWLDTNMLDKIRTLATLPLEARSLIDRVGQFLRGSYSGPPRLCHGDLVWPNLIADRGRLSAIIDWNPIFGWDPAFDVATWYFWLDDEPILTTLLQAYAHDEPELFRRRIMAAVICYAAYLIAAVWKPTIDKQALDRRCLRWLTEKNYAGQFGS